MKLLSLLFSLLLLCTLFFEAKGIRIVKSFQLAAADHTTIQEKNKDLMMKKNNEDVTATICTDGKCSGRTTNVMTQTTSTRKAVTKESLSPVSIPQDAISSDPDIVDIAGMDYSAAKRKPPIHN